MNASSIHFEQANLQHKEIIFQWLDKPHVKEFWDNSQAHRDDIVDFINGRKGPTPYFGGIFTYWVGMMDNNPFCFLLTAEYIPNESSPSLWKEHCSKSGKTYTIDFCIGNEIYLGKGLASLTLDAFTRFFQKEFSKEADTFLIDPDVNNPKARHVYEKAGFKPVGHFIMQDGFFSGHESILMAKRLPNLVKATLVDYPIIQAMSLFYIYEVYCEDIPGWEYPKDGQFKSLDYKKYFTEPNHAFLIKVNDELAGFALIDKACTQAGSDWNMGQFFILGKFQQSHMGEHIAFELWDQFKGIWEVLVIPENIRALNFWRKIIAKYTHHQFAEELKTINYETGQSMRYVFTFSA